MDDDDWLEKLHGLPVDVSGLLAPQATARDQYKSDAALWYHTLFDTDDRVFDLNQSQQDILKEQQKILKRHFLAMAVFGVQQGDQDTQQYQPYEDASVPLAALASHGGRFAYEAADRQVGDRFYRSLLVGDADANEEFLVEGPRGLLVTGSVSRSLNPAKQREGFHAGLYARRSTHPQKYSTRHQGWKEKQSSLGEKTGKSFGLNLAFGGIGNQSGVDTIVGPEGAIFERTRPDRVKRREGGQHGAAFIKYESHTNKSEIPEDAGGRLMIGFEGSGPDKDSLFGAHGLRSAFESNSRSLTGQGKASDLGLPTSQMGGVKAVVNQVGVDRWTTLVRNMNVLHVNNEPLERMYFKRLLASTGGEERMAIEREVNQLAALIERRLRG